MTQRIDFRVIGEQTIHCAGCEQRIGNALRRLKGVETVDASADTQQVAVGINPDHVSPDEVRSRLGLLGYEVRREGD